MTGSFAPPVADFGVGLSRLAGEIRDARQRANFEAALSRAGESGQLDPRAIGLAALASGNPQIGLAAAQLAQADEDRRWRQSTDQRNFAAQRSDVDFQQRMERDRLRFQERTQDRADQPNRELHDRARQAGFTPGTPDYQRFMERGGQAPPRLAGTDIERLSNVGGRLTDAERFQTTFRPEFGGWRMGAVGNLANSVERTTGLTVAPGSAAWWQEYDRYRNSVRHDLFGSALTVNEQRAFDAADINPGMTPQAIQANLAIQRRAAEDAARRLAAARVANGDDPEVVAQAMGVPLARLGIQPRPARPAAAPAAAPGATAAPQATAQAPAPQPQQFREGQRIQNRATGEIREWRNGQWVPVTQ